MPHTRVASGRFRPEHRYTRDPLHPQRQISAIAQRPTGMQPLSGP